MQIKKSNLIMNKDLKLHRFKGTEHIDWFKEKFRREGVVVYFDPDIDGAVSGLLACMYLGELGIPYTWYINSKREHGFLMPIEKAKGHNFFCVDFLIDRELMSELVKSGCSILSIDHHDTKDEFIECRDGDNFGIVINNQYHFEEGSSRYLSGGGVVFESLVSVKEDFNNVTNRALVGLSLLTDIRNIENINARLYLQDLYEHKCKGYIKYLLENTVGSVDYSFGVMRLDRNFVDYLFSPTLNSLFRFNKEDEVIEFILGSGVLDKSYRLKQKNLVSEVIETVEVSEYEHIRVIKIDSMTVANHMEYISCFIGLIASKFLKGDKSVISYLEDTDGVILRASFRGRINGYEYLTGLEKVIKGVGHGPAFGIKNLIPTKSLFEKISDKCGELEGLGDFKLKYIKSSNLSMLVNSNRAYSVGVENIFCLSQNRTYIRYTGTDVKNRRSGNGYKDYEINGVSIKSFNMELDPAKDLILPVVERGVLNFYLDKEFIED